MAKIIDIGQIEEFLGNIWAFEQMAPEHLHSLAQLVIVENLAEGEILWLQGQAITHFTIVYYGQLRSVRRSSGGSEKLLSTLNRGRHFGLAEMITGQASSVTIIAEKPSTILAINRKSLRRKLLSDVDICYRLMQTMARAIFTLTGELERASFENVHTRLARVLLSKDFGRYGLGELKGGFSGTAGPGAPGNTSHEELAVRLGVSRETVSRSLAEFRRSGLIKTAYRNIRVINRRGLMEYVEQ